jgi:hypothetical protein
MRGDAGLPRSRKSAPGQYQERLWCSFEAAMVQLRSIPVAVAGFGLSSRQRSVAVWGSLLPLPPWAKDRGDAALRRLGQVNFWYVAFILCMPIDWLIWWGYAQPFTVLDLVTWVIMVVIGTLYLLGTRSTADVVRGMHATVDTALAWPRAHASTPTPRPCIHVCGCCACTRVRAARHGKYVLRIMYAAAQGKETTSETNLAEMLKINMPWLAGCLAGTDRTAPSRLRAHGGPLPRAAVCCLSVRRRLALRQTTGATR